MWTRSCKECTVDSSHKGRCNDVVRSLAKKISCCPWNVTQKLNFCLGESSNLHTRKIVATERCCKAFRIGHIVNGESNKIDVHNACNPQSPSPNQLTFLHPSTHRSIGTTPPARSQYSVLIRTRLRVGVGVRVRVGLKDSTGVQSGQNFHLGSFGAHGASGAFGAHGLLRAAPLATKCWPEAPGGGGGG